MTKSTTTEAPPSAVKPKRPSRAQPEAVFLDTRKDIEALIAGRRARAERNKDALHAKANALMADAQKDSQRVMDHAVAECSEITAKVTAQVANIGEELERIDFELMACEGAELGMKKHREMAAKDEAEAALRAPIPDGTAQITNGADVAAIGTGAT